MERAVDDCQLEDELAGRFRSVADAIVVGRQTFLDMAERRTLTLRSAKSFSSGTIDAIYAE